MFRPAVSEGRVFGAYELVARLGVGGMGEAYLASRRERGHFRKLCVLKRLHKQLAVDASGRARFEQEGCVAARLNHANVVQTFEAGEVDGVPYLAMEYLDGQTLRSFTHACDASGIFPDPLLWVRIVADALAGLEHAHSLRDFDGSPLGVVHRDVSPHNIFVTYGGRVALIDFGMVKVLEGAGSATCRTLAGKPRYMAPEYIAHGTVDRRTDVFSMGVVLWEALAGRPMPIADVTAAGSATPRPRVTSVGRAIDPVLDAIVARATEIDPWLRYDSAGEMGAALEAYLDEVGPAPRREHVGELLAAYFEEDRARMHALVAAQMGDDKAARTHDFPSDSWDVRGRARPATEDSRVRVFALPGGSHLEAPATCEVIEIELDDSDIEESREIDDGPCSEEPCPASHLRATKRIALAPVPPPTRPLGPRPSSASDVRPVVR